MKSKVLQKLLDKIPPVTKRFYRLSGDAVDQIYTYLDEKGWDQKTLAEKLDKSESEISKLLSGKHNFTLESLAKIEDALQEDIFIVPNHIDKHQRTRTMIQQEIAANSNFLSENLQGLQLASSGIVIKSFKTNDEAEFSPTCKVYVANDVKLGVGENVNSLPRPNAKYLSDPPFVPVIVAGVTADPRRVKSALSDIATNPVLFANR